MRGCEDDSRGNMKSYYVDVGMTGCECALCVNVYASLRNIGYMLLFKQNIRTQNLPCVRTFMLPITFYPRGLYNVLGFIHNKQHPFSSSFTQATYSKKHASTL